METDDQIYKLDPNLVHPLEREGKAKRCIHCGRLNHMDARYCDYCSRHLQDVADEMRLQCEGCGLILRGTVVDGLVPLYCRRCGKYLDDERREELKVILLEKI